VSISCAASNLKWWFDEKFNVHRESRRGAHTLLMAIDEDK
jgi:hypothetical protein